MSAEKSIHLTLIFTSPSATATAVSHPLLQKSIQRVLILAHLVHSVGRREHGPVFGAVQGAWEFFGLVAAMDEAGFGHLLVWGGN